MSIEVQPIATTASGAPHAYTYCLVSGKSKAALGISFLDLLLVGQEFIQGERSPPADWSTYYHI